MQEKILITGARGQLGSVLQKKLIEIHRIDNVITSDIRHEIIGPERYVVLDILNTQRFKEVIHDYGITQIYHLAAILSANGEWNPFKTWNVNLNAFLDILELAKDNGVHRVFFPSTIAVFGKTTPRINTPQDCPLLPETVYGMSKVGGELWANYYYKRYGLDVRSLRFPGIIGYQSMPGGGTTDYAVEIFHEAILHGHYTCFLEKDTRLPMLYMPDAIDAIVQLMARKKSELSIHYSYNLHGMSFSPEELAGEIKKYIPQFTIDYKPDFRQDIAASWTESIDDTMARTDWNWKPKYDLETMVKDMIKQLRRKYQKEDSHV